jgi:hypothetical protein
MPNKKISEDSLITSDLVNGATDYIPIVTPSEPNESDRNKRILINELSELFSAGSEVNIAVVTASSSQILNCNTTPILLIPAPGIGKTIMVSHVYAKLSYNSIPYATNTQYVIGYSGGGHAITGSLDGGFLSGSGNRYLYTFGKEGIVSSDIVENRGVVFRTNTGNPTAGNSPIKFAVIYAIVTN